MALRMSKAILTSLILGLFTVMLAVPAYAEDGYALLVQQSPPDGGSVNLGSGVHKVGIGENVALSATPKPGYRFLYWLGDVSAADTMETSIEVDSPKMVVAVFARDDFEDVLSGGAGAGERLSGGGGGGGRRGGFNPILPSASVSPASGPAEIDYPDYIYEYDPTNNYDIPVPGDGDDIPVPGGEEVPEPTTILLLGLGSAAFLRRKK